MSITDELRELADVSWIIGRSASQTVSEIIEIADRIDAEHEKALRELNDYVSASILLPKDADGKVINIGDELDGYGYPHGGDYCKAIVNKFMILAGPKDSSYRTWLMWEAKEVRHHHEPTVEDVLREFGEKYCDMVTDSDDEKTLFAEYAAKLQLRGDGE